MKYNINIFIFIIATLLLSSCDKEEVEYFDSSKSYVDFTSTTGQYSFLKSKKDIDTLRVEFAIHGIAKDVITSAKVTVVKDSTTFNEDSYEILSANVNPGEYFGTVDIRLTKPADIGTQDLVLYLRLEESDDFLTFIDEKLDAKITINNKLIRPNSWTRWLETYYIGSYSTAYYQFIIDQTGIEEFYYNYPAPEGVEEWQYFEMMSFLELLKTKLEEYNKTHPILLHDDGEAEGSPVVIGKNYV